MLYTLFILGSVSTIGGTNEAGRDYWLSFLIGGIIGLGFNQIYTRIGQKMVKTSRLFRAVSAITATFTAAISLSLFTTFISQMTLVATPDVIIASFIALTVYMMCRGGLSVLTRLGELIFPVVIILITIASLGSLEQADFTALLPILQNGIAPLLNGTFTSFAFYFAEGFTAVMLLSQMEENGNRKSGIIWGTIFVTAFVTMIFIRNLAVLGYPFVGSLYFPSYTVASIITLGKFFQRMEVLISIVFILCKLMKICILEEYVKMTAESLTGKAIGYGIVTLVIFNLSQMLFSGIADAFIWLETYRYYLILPCIILPLIEAVRLKNSK